MAGNNKQKTVKKETKKRPQQLPTPSYNIGLDSENVGNLTQSVGIKYIKGNPVSEDQFGRLISGRHRKATGKWPETIVIEVEDDAEYWLDRFLGTTQRRSTFAEHVDIVAHYCEALSQKGWKNTRIVKHLLDLNIYGESYTRALIPTQYKDPTKAKAGSLGGVANAANFATMTGADTYSSSIPQVTIARDGEPKAIYMENRVSESDFTTTNQNPMTFSNPHLPLTFSSDGWIPALCPHCMKALRVMADGTVVKAV